LYFYWLFVKILPSEQYKNAFFIVNIFIVPLYALFLYAKRLKSVKMIFENKTILVERGNFRGPSKVEKYDYSDINRISWHQEGQGISVYLWDGARLKLPKVPYCAEIFAKDIAQAYLLKVDRVKFEHLGGDN
jgi:hypothetical protein